MSKKKKLKIKQVKNKKSLISCIISGLKKTSEISKLDLKQEQKQDFKMLYGKNELNSG